VSLLKGSEEWPYIIIGGILGFLLVYIVDPVFTFVVSGKVLLYLISWSTFLVSGTGKSLHWIATFVPNVGFLSDITTFCAATLSFLIPVSMVVIQQISEKYGSTMISKRFRSSGLFRTLVGLLVMQILLSMAFHSIDLGADHLKPSECPSWWFFGAKVVLLLFFATLICLVAFIRNLLTYFYSDELFEGVAMQAEEILSDE